MCGIRTVDTFVHEFCKLFGTNGVPKYTCGRSFKDFLQLKVADNSCKFCYTLPLDRQVRAFVSAANATKILYLVESAKEYLNYTGKGITLKPLFMQNYTTKHCWLRLKQMR